MKIDLAAVKANEGEKKTFLFSESMSENKIEFSGESIEITQPVNVSGHVVNYEGKIHMQISIKTSIKRICSRCLNPYEELIDISANYVFGKDYQEEDKDLSILTGDAIEIDDIVLDEIISQISMKPLCAEDCKGLCHICGINRNLLQCDCVIDEVDPRLEILKSLLEKE